MNLNDYRINEVITLCNRPVDYGKIILNNIIFFLSSSALAGGGVFLFTREIIRVLLCLASVLVVTVVKTKVEIKAEEKPVIEAGRQLSKIVKTLRQNGIDTSKLKLMKAQMSSKRPENMFKNNAVVTEFEQRTVFHDNLGQLKALRQVCYKILEMTPDEPTYLPYSDYTEIIEDSEKAKQLAKVK